MAGISCYQPLMRRTLSVILVGMLTTSFGCGDDGGDDAGLDAAGVCSSAADCDDGTYCNGAEQCDPASAAANASGCVPGSAPCEGECDEDANACEGECADRDGDGVADIACGGEDCDDTDPDRFPGNLEVCDSIGHDEDCDTSTLGPDEDGDGYVDDECCNTQGDGSLLCGLDCNDDSSDINPEVVDICGNGDQDCDGDIDEDPNERVFRDMDGDGYGVNADSMLACMASSGFARLDGDCDDTDGAVNPGEEELCDSGMVDENCDGAINDGCACSPEGATRSCGATDVGECRFGVQTCIEDADARTRWGACVDQVEPRAELCNGLDDDCNGTVDDGASFECNFGDSETGLNACERSTTRNCDPGTCTWTPPDFNISESASTCDYCDDSGAGLTAEQPFATATVSWDIDDATLNFCCLGESVIRSGELFDATEVGYGTVTLEGRVSVKPSNSDPMFHGWALRAIREDTSSPIDLFGPADGDLAVPIGRYGGSAEWYWYDDRDMSSEADTLVLRNVMADMVLMRDASVTPRLDRNPLASSTTRVNQYLRMTITPDLPGDGSDDTEIVVEYSGNGTSWTFGVGCGGARAACPFTIATGERWHFGATMVDPAGPDTVSTFSYLDLVRENVCP